MKDTLNRNHLASLEDKDTNLSIPTNSTKTIITNITNIIEKEERRSASFHIRPSVVKAFRQYCKMYPGKKGGELAEEAFSSYMKSNPISKVNLSIVNVMKHKRTGAQRRLLYRRLIETMTDKMNTLDAIQISGRGNYDMVKEELGKLVDKAIEIEVIDEDFEKLLERAETYFD